MSTKAIIKQIDRLARCAGVLRQSGIEIEHVHIPDDPVHGPRVYVQPSAQLQRMPGAVYKIQGTAAGRTEHHSVPLDGCQVRWQQMA